MAGEEESDPGAGAKEVESQKNREKLERVSESGPQDDEDSTVSAPQPMMGKLAAFALQLMEEFLSQYKLEETVKTLQAELEKKGVPRPDPQLWFEMHSSCRVAIARGSSTASNKSSLEKLLAFCASPKAALALDVIAPPVALCLASPQPSSISKLKQTSFSLRQAYSQMLSPVVRPSQRHKQPGTPSATPTERRPKTDAGNKSESPNPGDLLDIDVILEQSETRSRPSSSVALGPIELQPQTVTLSKKRKSKKKRGHGSGSDSSNNKGISQPHRHPSRTESSMVMAYDEQIKRDLSSGRLLARELRILRAERVKCDTLRRGTAAYEAALARHDPYAKELVRERYGFIHRVECALCTFPFLPVNLPHRVSFKCIMDLHELWGYAPPQREVAARYRPPLCYDAVRVCRMCGPILFQHTTATPSVIDEQLSPTMPRASSLSALTSATGKGSPKTKARAAMVDAESAEQRTFCSDPYALPPLFGDDVIEDGESYGTEDVQHEILRGNGAGAAQEFPAKAIVYSQQQTDTVAFMSSKEWEVINPMRSSIRQVMENTVKWP